MRRVRAFSQELEIPDRKLEIVEIDPALMSPELRELHEEMEFTKATGRVIDEMLSTGALKAVPAWGGRRRGSGRKRGTLRSHHKRKPEKRL